MVEQLSQFFSRLSITSSKQGSPLRLDNRTNDTSIEPSPPNNSRKQKEEQEVDD